MGTKAKEAVFATGGAFTFGGGATAAFLWATLEHGFGEPWPAKPQGSTLEPIDA